MRTKRRFFITTLLILIISVFSSEKGQPQIVNVNDETYLLLALKKQRTVFEETKERYERKQKMFKEGLISKVEFQRDKREYDIQLINYQQAMLRVIFDQPYIIIEEAKKYRTKDGKKRVKLKIRNTTGGTLDYEKLLKAEGDIFTDDLKPDKINNVFISLMNTDVQDQTIISKPYEIKIPRIRFGESKYVDFELLRDVDAVRVTMYYAEKTEYRSVYLEKDASENMVDVISLQFSQEADLGANAIYNLDLERFSDEYNVYDFRVINLPKQISYSYNDPETNARLTTIKFTQGITSKKINLTVYLPERDDEEVVIDKSIPFYVAVLPHEETERLGDLREKKFSEEEIGKIQGGVEKIELIPRGVGKIEVQLTTLYYPIKAGEQLEWDVIVKNGGTRRLDNVKLETDHPLNWRAEIIPDLIKSLDVGKETSVRFKITPEEDVGVGDYLVRIKTESIADNRRVETEDKEVRVHIEAPTNIISTIILITLVLGITIGVVVAAIKISRR